MKNKGNLTDIIIFAIIALYFGFKTHPERMPLFILIFGIALACIGFKAMYVKLFKGGVYFTCPFCGTKLYEDHSEYEDLYCPKCDYLIRQKKARKGKSYYGALQTEIFLIICACLYVRFFKPELWTVACTCSVIFAVVVIGRFIWRNYIKN